MALHYTLEMMNEFNDQELENALISSKNRYGSLLENSAFISIKRRVSNLLNDEEFKFLIQNGEVFKEQPFMFRENRKQIDLLVKLKDKLVIIDYKTSPFVRESHITQVNEYKDALQEITKTKTEAIIYYLHEERVEVKKV
ncbi:MAG: hypothetical protein ACK5LP_02670 [Campylobacteraceae bacterium]